MNKFILKDQSQGYLIKYNAIKGSTIKEQLGALVKQHSNSMFILTAPTEHLHSEYGKFPYPGHNCVFISNKTCMSKRQDASHILFQRKRAPDARFIAAYAPNINFYNPRFTSYEEELEVWEKRAICVPGYPLFVHILPLNTALGIDAETFQSNVRNIIDNNAPYVLHSTVHPNADHLISPANCNGAMHEAIFGRYNHLIETMFCQQASMTIMREFVADWGFYEKIAADMGLTKGIEISLFTEEDYRPSFTC